MIQMEKDNNKVQVIKAAIKLSGSSNKDFNELQLSKELNLSKEETLGILQSKLNLFFSTSRKTRVKCPKCDDYITLRYKNQFFVLQ